MDELLVTKLRYQGKQYLTQIRGGSETTHYLIEAADRIDALLDEVRELKAQCKRIKELEAQVKVLREFVKLYRDNFTHNVAVGNISVNDVLSQTEVKPTKGE